jgi:hypothetical protein
MSDAPLQKNQSSTLDLGSDRTPLRHLRALLAEFDEFDGGASAFVKLRSPGPDSGVKQNPSRFLTIEVES